jgi:N-acylneuraminate cytidylyltransferase
MKNRVLAIITARGGSKGIPNKNMKIIGESPLIKYSIDSLNDSKLVTTKIVSTDNDIIGKYCLDNGVDFPFVRPENLANDSAKSIDVLTHAINFYKNNDQLFDYVLLIQPTTPFRTKGIIDQSISKLILSQKNTLISVKKVNHQYNPNWQFKLSTEDDSLISYEKTITSRRQDLDDTFIRDGSIYLVKCDFLLKENSFFDKSIEYIIDHDAPNINIDTHDDLFKANQYVKSK